MTLYDITTGWLTWVNQSLADGTNPSSGRNLFTKAKNTTFTGVNRSTKTICLKSAVDGFGSAGTSMNMYSS